MRHFWMLVVLATVVVGIICLDRLAGIATDARRTQTHALAEPAKSGSARRSGDGAMHLSLNPPAEWRARNVPPECFKTLRGYFEAIKSDEIDLVEDRVTRERFVTADLSEQFQAYLATFVYEDGQEPGPEYPNNNDFLMFWESPDEIALLGARRYEKTAFIDLLFMPGPDQNYSGEFSFVTYRMIWDNRACRIDDSYIFSGQQKGVATLREIFAYRP